MLLDTDIHNRSSTFSLRKGMFEGRGRTINLLRLVRYVTVVLLA